MNDNFKGVWIPKDILAIKKLNLTQKLLLSIMVSLSQKDGNCKPSNGYLSMIVGISKTSISINLNTLCKLGYIGCTIKLKGGTQEVLYRVCKPTYRGYASKLIYPPQANLDTSPSKLGDPPQANFKGIEVVDSIEYNKEDRKEDNKEAPSKNEKPKIYPIDELVEELRQLCGGSLDGTIDSNSTNCLDCLEKIASDFPKVDPVDSLRILMKGGKADKFHGKNLTSFSYLFRYMNKIRESIKINLYGHEDPEMAQLKRDTAAKLAGTYGKE